MEKIKPNTDKKTTASFPSFKRTRELVCLFVLIFGPAGFSFSMSSPGTTMNGMIEENTTWTRAGNPYIIQGRTIVKTGVTLNLDPGVDVRFNPGAELIIEGAVNSSALILRGAQDAPVRLSFNAPLPRYEEPNANGLPNTILSFIGSVFPAQQANKSQETEFSARNVNGSVPDSSLPKIKAMDCTPPLVMADQPGGTYAPLEVSLSTNETAEIHYTLDGSEPSVSSPLYHAPLSISKDTLLKIIAVDKAGNQSPVAVYEYLVDTDKDGLGDSLEIKGCTNPKDADTDNDGILDGVEDANRNGRLDPGETDPRNADTDHDGLQDGTEIGLASKDAGPDTDLARFQPDLDPATTTDPLDADTDDDGLTDGQEDPNRNGKVDAGEKDPMVKLLEFHAGSADLTNPYAYYQAGKKYIFSGTGTFHGFSRYFYAKTVERIDGVDCLQIIIRGHGHDPDPEKDQEYYKIWLAQDSSRVVWLLQMYDGLEDKITTFGVANAVLWMPFQPVLDQEFKKTANEVSVVENSGVTVVSPETALGVFTDCLKIRRVTGQGSDSDTLYFAPLKALVKEEWNDNNQENGWELKEVETPLFVDELVVNFGINGLLRYHSGLWTRLADIQVEGLYFYDRKLLVDAGSRYGLWGYDGKSWKQISTWDADNAGKTMTVYQNGLVVDFGAQGLQYYNGAVWIKFTDLNVQHVETYADKLVVDTGAKYGLWEYDGKAWKQISALDADNTGNSMTVYQNGLSVDFGSQGLQYYSGTTWIKLADADVEWLATYQDRLVVDAGAYGLYEYNGEGWQQISAMNADNTGHAPLAAYNGMLFVDFGLQGLYSYDGAQWTKHTDRNVESLTVYGDKLVADVGSKYGLWEYDGRSWKQISKRTAGNAGNTMIGVDLFP